MIRPHLYRHCTENLCCLVSGAGLIICRKKSSAVTSNRMESASDKDFTGKFIVLRSYGDSKTYKFQ
jgi:hypothetical protein